MEDNEKCCLCYGNYYHMQPKSLGNWDGNSFSDENLLQTFLIGMENLHMVNECVK